MLEEPDDDEFVTPYTPYVPYEAPTIPTLQGGLARCARCRSMFMEGGDDACVYHPGVYRGGVTCRPPHGIVRHGWSCCNGEAGSAGCTPGVSHPEQRHRSRAASGGGGGCGRATAAKHGSFGAVGNGSARTCIVSLAEASAAPMEPA